MGYLAPQWVSIVLSIFGVYFSYKAKAKTALGRYVFWYFALTLTLQITNAVHSLVIPVNPTQEWIRVSNAVSLVSIWLARIPVAILVYGCYTVLDDRHVKQATARRGFPHDDLD